MTATDIGLYLFFFWLFILLFTIVISRHTSRDADGYRQYINKLKENEDRMRRQDVAPEEVRERIRYAFTYIQENQNESKEVQRLKEQNRKLMERINYIENNRG